MYAKIGKKNFTVSNFCKRISQTNVNNAFVPLLFFKADYDIYLE